MRYFELFENKFISMGIYSPEEDQSTLKIRGYNKPITLMLLNKLKKIRVRRQFERKKKLKILPVIYGDQDIAFELQQQKIELDNLKDQISIEAEKANVELEKNILEREQEQWEHISSIADRTIRQKKSE